MSTSINSVQRSIIKNMMLSRSFKEISSLLGYDETEVRTVVSEMTEGTGIITFQQKLNDRKAKKKVVKKVRVSKPASESKKQQSAKQSLAEQKKEDRRLKMLERTLVEQKRANERRLSRQTIPTKKIDYTQLVTVRIDRQTIIYAKAGEEEATKQRFLKNYTKPIDKNGQAPQ